MPKACKLNEGKNPGFLGLARPPIVGHEMPIFAC